jgi:methionyl-tRNA formyltransferase
MGTPDLACESLRALYAEPGFEVVQVVTQPDRPKGRDLKLTPSPVKTLALSLGLPVLQPERAREPGFIQAMAALKSDLIAVAAFGQILPPALLELPKHGCLNVHTSLLPRYRGAAPIQWSILNGDSHTGVTIMKMDAGLDTGAIISQEKTEITPSDTAETLHDRLAQIGARLLTSTIPQYIEGRLMPVPQDNAAATHAPKIKKEHGHIDWTASATTLWNRVRGLIPWPGAFCYMPVANGGKTLLKIWGAEVVSGSGEPGTILEAGNGKLIVACETGALSLTTLQREGGRRMATRDFLAGHPLLKKSVSLL